MEWSCPGSVEEFGLSSGEDVLAPTFVMKRGQIVQGRVSAMEVVSSLDEPEDGDAGLGDVYSDGLEARPVEEPAPKGGDEGLGHGVVMAIPD